MSRTNARWESKGGITDAFLPMDASDFFSVGAGASALVLNAKGDVSFNMAASLAGKWICSLTGLLYRKGLAPFLNQQFGTAAGVAGPTAVANTSDPDGTSGVAPFTGASQFTTQTGFAPKGIRVVDYVLHYLIGTNPLALHTSGLSKTVKPLPTVPAALVVTDVVANAANGLATAANALVQSTLIPVASPVFNVTDLSELMIEVDATTPVGGTYRMYGATVHIAYNF